MRLLITLIFFFASTAITHAQILAARHSVFYASPAGWFASLGLGPSNVGTKVCDPTKDGLMVIDNTSPLDYEFYICNGNTASWERVDNPPLWVRDIIDGELYQNTLTDQVGIGTSEPDAGLHIIHDDGFLAEGTFGSGTPLDFGTGTGMIWYPLKGAFRAGEVTAGQWNDASIGNYSVAFGFDNIAQGDYSVVFGSNNNITGNYSFAFGDQITSAFDGSFIFSQNPGTTLTGPDVVFDISGNFGIGAGAGATAPQQKLTVAGDIQLRDTTNNDTRVVAAQGASMTIVTGCVNMATCAITSAGTAGWTCAAHGGAPGHGVVITLSNLTSGAPTCSAAGIANWTGQSPSGLPNTIINSDANTATTLSATVYTDAGVADLTGPTGCFTYICPGN